MLKRSANGAALMILTACGTSPSSTTTPDLPSAAVEPTGNRLAIDSLRADAVQLLDGCGDKTASIGYRPLGGDTYAVEVRGKLNGCGEENPFTHVPIPGNTATWTGHLDRFQSFVVRDFSFGQSNAPLEGLRPFPPPLASRPVPAAAIRELVMKAAGNCGDSHPKAIRFVRTTVPDAWLGPGIPAWTIEAFHRPVYALVATGRFTCQHTKDAPAVRTRMRLVMAADGSSLQPSTIVVDSPVPGNVDHDWPGDSKFQPLP